MMTRGDKWLLAGAYLLLSVGLFAWSWMTTEPFHAAVGLVVLFLAAIAALFTIGDKA